MDATLASHRLALLRLHPERVDLRGDPSDSPRMGFVPATPAFMLGCANSKTRLNQCEHKEVSQ